jgi:hypothetical protein
MLYECLGAYHSVNKAGALSYLYKFCLCCVYVLQTPFNNFDLWRIRKLLIANCRWEIGQLTNVLNMLYDPSQKRIYIGQSVSVGVYVFNIDEGESLVFVPNIDEGESSVFVPNIDESISSDMVTFYVPSVIYNDTPTKTALIADIEQIRWQGIIYQIVSL